MMMKMLDAAGLPTVVDNIRTADEDNPKGYFELEQVKELDKGGDKSWVRGRCRGKVIKVISFLLTDLPDDNHYKVIFMRRNLDEVIASQNKMLVRRGEPTDTTKDERMIKLYRDHLLKVRVQMRHRSNYDLLELDHRQALESPLEAAGTVADFLGGDLDTAAMAAVVDNNLYRNRSAAAG